MAFLPLGGAFCTCFPTHRTRAGPVQSLLTSELLLRTLAPSCRTLGLTAGCRVDRFPSCEAQCPSPPPPSPWGPDPPRQARDVAAAPSLSPQASIPPGPSRWLAGEIVGVVGVCLGSQAPWSRMRPWARGSRELPEGRAWPSAPGTAPGPHSCSVSGLFCSQDYCRRDECFLTTETWLPPDSVSLLVSLGTQVP